MKRHLVSETTYISYLIKGHRQGILSAIEMQELEQWLNCTDENKQLLEELMDPGQQIKAIVTIGKYSRKQEMLEKIYSLPQQERADLNSIRLKNWSNSFLFKVAAAITILLTITIYFQKQQHKTTENKTSRVYNAAPGGNRAVITLADGRRINLNESKEAVVISANQLSYNDGTKVQGTPRKTDGQPQQLNTISTPKGGQYRIILADGTKVWLNAASSLKYPEQFNGDQRLVELSGEAYFEVSHQPQRPFLLKSGNQTIKVLGTQFNVNAYPDDANLKTTLLKGSIMVSESNTRNSKILIPGQQSSLGSGKTQNIIQVQNADVEEATAWKNGYFKFNDEPIESIMRKLSRWYNVEISYRDRISPDQVFSGRVSRFEAVSSVLEALELTGGVHFKIEERRIIVMK